MCQGGVVVGCVLSDCDVGVYGYVTRVESCTQQTMEDLHFLILCFIDDSSLLTSI